MTRNVLRSTAAESHNRESIAVSEKVQDEDMAICDAVQRGLHSHAYVAGRLSVRREAGEHLFHRLLHADLTVAAGMPTTAARRLRCLTRFALTYNAARNAWRVWTCVAFPLAFSVR
jgi:hypothetical protein